ncbi:MAG TPA: class I SAM-dependent methyltransferase [Gemmatimonadales bacterium]|nr:class I SAM-dependent methyltransferase [Gemmatimonadales bacterium]
MPMLSAAAWTPTKYVIRDDRLRAAADPRIVSIGSRLMVDAIAARYTAAIPLHCRGDVLDLGCGRAPLYGLYRHFAGTITCVDWADSEHDVRHADVLCDLNEPIPFPDASFDTIIFSDVMEHLYRPQQALEEIRRVLRPEGTLLMNLPFMYPIHEQPHDYYRYTRFALERMLGDASLEAVALESIGGAPEVLVDLVSKLFLRMRIAGPSLAGSAQAVAGWWVRTKPGRWMSTSTAAQFPFGYFLIARPR